MPKPNLKPPKRDWGERLGRAADDLTDYLESLERKRANRPARELPFFAWIGPREVLLVAVGAQLCAGVALLLGGSALMWFLAAVSFGLAALMFRQIRFAHHANLILSSLSLLTIPFGSLLATFMGSSSEQGLRSGGLGMLGVVLVVFLGLSALGSVAALWQDR